MNWIRQELLTNPKTAADAAELLAKIEAGDTSTRLAAKVKGLRDDYAHGDAEFALWMALVDRRITRRIGLGLFDLSDWPMRDAFDDGVSPREGAEMALAADDTFGSL